MHSLVKIHSPTPSCRQCVPLALPNHLTHTDDMMVGWQITQSRGELIARLKIANKFP